MRVLAGTAHGQVRSRRAFPITGTDQSATGMNRVRARAPECRSLFESFPISGDTRSEQGLRPIQERGSEGGHSPRRTANSTALASRTETGKHQQRKNMTTTPGNHEPAAKNLRARRPSPTRNRGPVDAAHHGGDRGRSRIHLAPAGLAGAQSPFHGVWDLRRGTRCHRLTGNLGALPLTAGVRAHISGAPDRGGERDHWRRSSAAAVCIEIPPRRNRGAEVIRSRPRRRA